MIENEMTVSVPLEVVKASEIEPKEVKWLWYPYIPVGKVTLLQGDPGDGKSKLMLSIAAEPLPFTETEENEPMTIIYQTTEDDADDTVVPRFNSAGGNGENLIFIKEDEKSLSFGDNRIREAIEMYHAKLLILDPMSSYIGENCSMNNANETRAEFNHLIAVAKNEQDERYQSPLPYQRFYRHCGRCEKYSRHHTNRKQRKSSRTLFGASKIQSCSNGFGYSF